MDKTVHACIVKNKYSSILNPAKGNYVQQMHLHHVDILTSEGYLASLEIQAIEPLISEDHTAAS